MVTTMGELILSEVTKPAQKVKRHRIRLAIVAVAISVVAACLLSLVFLTIKAMHIQANPMIYQVEEGVYNLTANDLTTSASDVDDYIFSTNNSQIKVAADKNVDQSAEVLLWNVDDRNNPFVILYGKITTNDSSCTFTGLSSSHRYMVTCDGHENMMVTVSEGRNAGFFGCMKDILIEIYTMLK